MSDLPTVKIKHEGGYCIINESDFNPDEHELFEEEGEENQTKKRGRKPKE